MKIDSQEVDHLKRWMFFNCPKSQAWIVFQNLGEILEGTVYRGSEVDRTDPIPPLEGDQIRYIHSVVMTDKQLLCLVETGVGFYLINNQREIVEKEAESVGESLETPGESLETPGESLETPGESLGAPGESLGEDQMFGTDEGKIFEARPDEGDPEEDQVEVRLISEVWFCEDLLGMLTKTGKDLLNLLEIKKPKLMKLTPTQMERSVMPYDYPMVLDDSQEEGSAVADQFREKLRTEVDAVGHLDLSYNYRVSDPVLSSLRMESGREINQLTLNTCLYLRSFKWCQAEWAKSVRRINLVNMPHFIDGSLVQLVEHLPNLEELYVHVCPQITVRCLLVLLKKGGLKIISLDNPMMPCQPNRYQGLISEEEWATIKNRRLERILINSTNLSLDIVDYLRKCCFSLKYFILHHELLGKLQQNVISIGDRSFPIHFVDTKKRRLSLGRDFEVIGLFKDEFNEPFSGSMNKVMEKFLAKEKEEHAKFYQEQAEKEKAWEKFKAENPEEAERITQERKAKLEELSKIKPINFDKIKDKNNWKI